MVLKTLYIIELTDTEEGGLELVDPSWCKYIINLIIDFLSCRA